jgi:hypothetical protein
MKTVSKMKISRVAPRKISMLLCQVSAATVVLFNVCKGSVTQFAVQQNASDKIMVSLKESATQPRKQNMETTEMTDTLKSINTTPHLCRSKVKQTALEIASAIRPANKFSRVGMSFVERIEAKVRVAIREEVRIHPSKGKTLL